VSGLRSTLMARASIKDEFRIEQTMIRASGNNPLKFSLDDDDALATLLGTGRRTGMGAAEAIADFNFVYVPGALPPQSNQTATVLAKRTALLDTTAVFNGIDVLVKQNFAPLRNLRVGLITNQTGDDRERNPTIDLLKRAPEVQLKALFSPEHGIRGQADEKIPDTVDQDTGLPIYSLYGETRRPKPEQLGNLDALVFDVQDIGSRFYTYISTLGLAMQAAASSRPASGAEHQFTGYEHLALLVIFERR
jgi:hypothetical protein